MSTGEENTLPRASLAPSGVSPYGEYGHEVEYSASGLYLLWMWDRRIHARKFTPEETYNLLKFLEQHRAEIEASNAQWLGGLQQVEREEN